MRPHAWFRYWFSYSLVGNLVWYLLGTCLSVVLLYGIKHAMADYVPQAGTGVDFAMRIATTENVNLAYAITMVQLVVNLGVSMAYNLRITQSLAAIGATCLPEYRDIAQRLRLAMAERVVDMLYWVRTHPDITIIMNQLTADSRKYSVASPESRRFEGLRAHVDTAVALYYNPLTIRMFVHSAFAVGTLMALKTAHNLKSDGLAALPFTLFIGFFFTGFLLFIQLADNPFFDDEAAPRMHAHTLCHLANTGAITASVAPTQAAARGHKGKSADSKANPGHYALSDSNASSVSAEVTPRAAWSRSKTLHRRNAIVGDMDMLGAIDAPDSDGDGGDHLV